MPFFTSTQESTGSLFFLCVLKGWLCSQKYPLPLFKDTTGYWIWASRCPVTKPPDQAEKTCVSVPLYYLWTTWVPHWYHNIYVWKCHSRLPLLHIRVAPKMVYKRDSEKDVKIIILVYVFFVWEYAFLIILRGKVLECLSSSKCFCNFMNVSKVLCGNSVGKCRMTCT